MQYALACTSYNKLLNFSVLHTQLHLNHSALNAHLVKNNCKPSPSCNCGHRKETEIQQYKRNTKHDSLPLQVDVAVVEVGIGGAYDSTNIIRLEVPDSNFTEPPM